MRIRAIKPEFWTDARVGEWDAQQALFFVGLWQVADDSGRLRLDPRLIRAELDPFDAKFGGVAGVEELLEELVRLGRVLPYEAGGQRFGLVAHFADHQVINKPTKSRLPAPPEGLREASGSPTVGLLPKVGVEGKGREGIREEEEEGKGKDPGAARPPSSLASPLEDQVLADWNAMAEEVGLPRCRGSDKVRKLIKARAKAPGWLEAFRGALVYLKRSPFHRGENQRGWRADLEFVLQDGKAEKLADDAEAGRPGGLQGAGDAQAAAQGRELIFGFAQDGSPVRRCDLEGLARPDSIQWAPWEHLEFNDPDSWRDWDAFNHRDPAIVLAGLVELVQAHRQQSKAKDPRAAAPPSPPESFKTTDRWDQP